MTVLEKATKVFSCCGQYYAVTKACSESKVICPRCNKQLTVSLRTPVIQIVKKK